MKQARLPKFYPLPTFYPEDQINSFVSSDTENDNTNSLETLEVMDNAYKHAKYKKIKDVLVPEIKNDIRDFEQN